MLLIVKKEEASFWLLDVIVGNLLPGTPAFLLYCCYNPGQIFSLKLCKNVKLKFPVLTLSKYISEAPFSLSIWKMETCSNVADENVSSNEYSTVVRRS